MDMIIPVLGLALLSTVLCLIAVTCHFHERIKTLEEQCATLWSLCKRNEGRLRDREEESALEKNAEEKFQEGLKNILFFGGED